MRYADFRYKNQHYKEEAIAAYAYINKPRYHLSVTSTVGVNKTNEEEKLWVSLSRLIFHGSWNEILTKLTSQMTLKVELTSVMHYEER